MTINGISQITPADARARANVLKSEAAQLDALLADVKRRMADINDESTGTYHGAKRPSELRAELDSFSETFVKFNTQIEKFASDVEAAANTMENQ